MTPLLLTLFSFLNFKKDHMAGCLEAYFKVLKTFIGNDIDINFEEFFQEFNSFKILSVYLVLSVNKMAESLRRSFMQW